MRNLTLLAVAAAAMAASSPALAGSPDGRWQIKLLGTGVLVDGKITKVEPAGALPGGAQTDINDNVVPTVAIEYFATPNLSVETICCLTQHHAVGAGLLPSSARIVDHIMILPATVTLKYHLNAGPIKPYVGVGPSVFFFIDETPGAAATALLGAARTKLDNKVGVALQAGVDIPVNDSGLGVSLDAKKYFMKTKAHFYTSGGAEILATTHKLDPWLLSAGVSYRF